MCFQRTRTMGFVSIRTLDHSTDIFLRNSSSSLVFIFVFLFFIVFPECVSSPVYGLFLLQISSSLTRNTLFKTLHLNNLSFFYFSLRTIFIFFIAYCVCTAISRVQSGNTITAVSSCHTFNQPALFFSFTPLMFLLFITESVKCLVWWFQFLIPHGKW